MNKTIEVSGGVIHEVPQDIKQILLSDPLLLQLWNNLTPIQRNEWICWATLVKKNETRQKHIQRLQSDIKEGKKKPCCWPGCPHRNANAKKWHKDFIK